MPSGVQRKSDTKIGYTTCLYEIYRISKHWKCYWGVTAKYKGESNTHKFQIISNMQTAKQRQTTSVSPSHCNLLTILLQTTWLFSHWSQQTNSTESIGMGFDSLCLHADKHLWYIYEHLNHSSQIEKIWTGVVLICVTNHILCSSNWKHILLTFYHIRHTISLSFCISSWLVL